MGRRPGLSINDRISRWDFLKLVQMLLTLRVILDIMNTRFIVCKQVFDSSRSGRPRITLLREDMFIVTSLRCYHFMVVPKLVERLRHATGNIISVYTARNRTSVIQARDGHTRY